MPLLIILALCLAAFSTPVNPASAENAAAPARTLLYLSPAGELHLANISAKEARLPDKPLLPGRKMQRFAVTPDGARVLFETARQDGVHSAWLLDLATRRVTALGDGLLLPSGAENPFTPDGRKIALRRQNRDEVAIFATGTGGVLRTLSAPGMQEAPAWFSDARHLAIEVLPAAENSTLCVFDAQTGEMQHRVANDTAGIRYRFAHMAGGSLIYRETREGVDSWLSLDTDGETLPVDEPRDPALPPDLPDGVNAVLSPEGTWVAYLEGNDLYLRYSAEGAEAVQLVAAAAFLWKPGAPLPEKPVTPPPPKPVVKIEPTTPANVPGIITFRALSSEAVEGQPLEMTWEAGRKVASVRLSAFVERTPKGPVKRGSYTLSIARAAARQGRYAWQVPWLDNITFVVRAEALDASQRVLGRASRTLAFRPRALANNRNDGIYVHLSEGAHQRLYLQKDGRLTLVLLCSGSSANRPLPLNEHPDAPHDHYGTFHVLVKDPDHVSTLNDDWKMPYAMRYLAGHYIHVTGRNQYSRLGRPGSHGCVRLHRADGIRLYQVTPIGETVVIY